MADLSIITTILVLTYGVAFNWSYFLLIDPKIFQMASLNDHISSAISVIPTFVLTSLIAIEINLRNVSSISSRISSGDFLALKVYSLEYYVSRPTGISIINSEHHNCHTVIVRSFVRKFFYLCYFIRIHHGNGRFRRPSIHCMNTARRERFRSSIFCRSSPYLLSPMGFRGPATIWRPHVQSPSLNSIVGN